MILKEVDFLSPQITLNYKGSLSHSSILSGILSIISFLIIIIFAICYSTDLIKRENPKVFYFNRFVEDSGIFPLNSSSIFHYISLCDKEIIKEFDFYSFRLVGFETYTSIYLTDRDLSKFDHWLYGFCNYEIDLLEIKHILNEENFQKSACIKKYYNSLDKTYYDIGNPKFRWPIIKHGNAHPDANGYSIIIEKCKEDTLELILSKGNKCKNESNMDFLFTGEYGTHFNLIDHYVDVLDYKHPNRKYIYRVENTLDKDNYSINHINLNPSSITTDDGVIFDNINEELSFIFERNDAFTESGKKNEVFMIFNLWMKNRMQYYKRIYKTFQEVISDIGGISEIIMLLAKFINSFYNNFIIISDFEKLISPSINKTINKKIMSSTEIIKVNKNIYNLETNKTNKSDIFKSQKNLKLSNDSLSKQEVLKQESNLNNYIYIKEKELNDKKDEKIFENERNEKYNFFNYFIHKISCNNSKEKYFRIYDKLRTKLISEGHLLKNILDVYSLIKMCEINNFELKNKYILKDLINHG